MEKRQAQRSRALKGARIVFNGGFSTIECVVRNLSSTGACLQVENAVGIPRVFDLILNGTKEPWPCQTKWHTGKLIGVEFR